MVLASVTPLASIFGSGFLIIVPALERVLGGLAVLGAAVVCGFAWLIGDVIRHNIRTVEQGGAAAASRVRLLERASDVVIAIAYVISVALYLRIMADYFVSYVNAGDGATVAIVASASVALIVVVGVFRGFSGLELMERASLATALAVTVLLGAAFFVSDLGQVAGAGLSAPPIPAEGALAIFLMLGGMLITVQGFETVRYLDEVYDPPTRIRASRLAQGVATVVYLGFVALATPLMAQNGAPDSDLIDITEQILPILGLPVVVCALLSQFSAATADTEAAVGNLHENAPRLMQGAIPYVLSGAVAVALIWSTSTFTLVTIASRAFAAYYFLQCLTAVATTSSRAKQAGFALLAAALLAITLFAETAS